MALSRVISGGQTGADRAALMVAELMGYPTGGWMPKGFRAHDGCHPDFADRFGMFESPFDDYPDRTERNVKDSDGTLCIALVWNPGERLTGRLVVKHAKPMLRVEQGMMPDAVIRWIYEKNISTLNVAGNSSRTAPEIYWLAYPFLVQVFNYCRYLETGTSGYETFDRAREDGHQQR